MTSFPTGRRYAAAALFTAFAFAAPALLALAGCASSGGAADDFDVSQEEIAAYPLPNTREVSHHPDRLEHARVSETADHIDIELSDSYRDLMLEWSAGESSGGSLVGSGLHATFWSKELSLASLVLERSIEGMSKDLGRRLVAERTAEYDSTIQIDVHVFAPATLRSPGDPDRPSQPVSIQRLRLDLPSRRVRLYDGNDNRYAPSRIETRPPRSTFRSGRERIYLRNLVFFDRYAEDGSDILESGLLRLNVRPDGLRFEWRFPEAEGAAVSSGNENEWDQRDAWNAP